MSIDSVDRRAPAQQEAKFYRVPRRFSTGRSTIQGPTSEIKSSQEVTPFIASAPVVEIPPRTPAEVFRLPRSGKLTNGVVQDLSGLDHK